MISTLSKKAVSKIQAIIESLFGRARFRFLGQLGRPKEIRIDFTKPLSHREDLSFGGLFDASSRSEGVPPDKTFRDSLAGIADNYLKVQEELAKTRVVNAVQTFLQNAENGHAGGDVGKVLRGELDKVWQDVSINVERIVDTESTKARNSGTVSAISKMSQALGIDDPTVAWLTCRDAHVCEECKKIHLLPDGITPRVWKMSEVTAGYHKKGEDKPSLSALHPHDRCSQVFIAPGFGFKGGKIAYISVDHDEWAAQRG